MSSSHTKQFTHEAGNVATIADASAGIDPSALDYEEQGDFFELLAASDFSLIVTREYEHFVLTLDGGADGPIQSAFPLPHPSGLWFDAERKELVLSSTRTPIIIMWMTPFRAGSSHEEIIPDDYDPPEDGVLFLPRQARYLPGTLYIHDVVKMGGEIYATITGHNFLAKLSLDSGWERVWWPKSLDGMGRQAFNQNYFQLNSIAVDGAPEKSFYTAFSNVVGGEKPWKEGYGPKGKGVVFSGQTRDVLYAGLTCPHSAKLHDGKLWLCNSGYGSIGYIENHASHDPEKTRYVEVAKAPGFTRGLAFAGDYMFVGLSKVIDKYEPYAPGLKPSDSKCGIWVFNWRSGAFVASLNWPTGYQLYDVQCLPGIKGPRLPLARRASDGINPILRYLD